MPDPRVNLKNRSLAAVLAFLVPGAGHFYQGRWFKAVIYSVGILGILCWGLSLGEWRVVYFRWQPRERTIGYIAQFMAGLPTLPALVQSYRYSHANNRGGRASRDLDFPSQAEFHGYAKHEATNNAWEGEVSGKIELSLEQGPFAPEVRGRFRGVLDADPSRQIELDLGGPLEIAPRLLASGDITPKLDGKPHPKEFSGSRRYLQCRIIEHRDQFDSPVGQLEGTIPRRFGDWFEMPVEDDALQDLNRRLGRRFEIALLFTWVAGLLNLLAVWDAFEGPAYGYGDEIEQPEVQAVNKTEAASSPSSAAATVPPKSAVPSKT